MSKASKYQVGEWVEVRTKEEILRTLDRRGQLEDLPFMPEMFAFCGRRFKVGTRAHKTCDTVNQTGGRRMTNAVHLEGVRCSGQAHGGCQALCMIFWKEAWIKRVDSQEHVATACPEASSIASGEAGCTEADVLAGARAKDSLPGDEPRYVCQTTQLPNATAPLPWWKIGQYVEDYASGNVTLGRLIKGGIYSAMYNLIQAGIGLGPPLRWLYDRVQALWGGVPFPRRSGVIPLSLSTPTGSLNLQAGDMVRVKSYREILATLNTDNKNRGLYFDAEMVPYCGGTYRVLSIVNQILDEKTGRLQQMKTPCIILEGVVCHARYSPCRMFCPRAIYSYWREIWLEREADLQKTGVESV